MRVKYLGTGASEGIPALFCSCALCKKARQTGGRDIRRRSSMAIDNHILFDFPPDVFSQCSEHKVDLSGLSDVFVTHTHADHFYPLELCMIRPPYAFGREGKTLRIYGSQEVYERIETAIPPKKLEEIRPFFEFVEVSPFCAVSVDEFSVTPLEARHGAGKAFIYMLEKDGLRVLYGHDSGFFPEATWDYIVDKRFDFVSLDCTNLKLDGVPAHMNFEDNMTVKKRMFQQGSADKKTRFASAHFSHEGNMSHYEIVDYFQVYGFTTAYDGLEITLEPQKDSAQGA